MPFLLAKGELLNEPVGVYGANPTVPADQQIYAFVTMTEVNGPFDVSFKWILNNNTYFITNVSVPSGYFPTYNVWSWLNPTLPSGQWGVEIDVGGFTGMTLGFNVEFPSIKETISWEGNVASGSHSFYLISFYGINTNNTLAGFQVYNVAYKTAIIYSPGQSRQDNITTSNVSQFDCLTIIAENYNTSTGQISGIYDAWIQNGVI